MKEFHNIEKHIELIFSQDNFKEIQLLFSMGVLNNMENSKLKVIMENRDFNLFKNLLKALIGYQQEFSELLFDFMEKVVRINSNSLRSQCDEILKDNDVELLLYLITSVIDHLKGKDKIFLFENTAYDLFEIIIKMSNHISNNINKSMDIQISAENLGTLFNSLDTEVREMIKKKILKYFQKEDFEALTLIINVGLLDYFSISEYINLFKESKYDLVKILIFGLMAPYWRVIDLRWEIFNILEKIEKHDDTLKKKVKEDIFRLFKYESKTILVELIMDQFFNYLDKNHIKILFQDSNSKLKDNFNEILTVENKDKEFGFSDYIERIEEFLVKINRELGKTFLFDIVNNLPNESKIILKKDLESWIDYPGANLEDLIQMIINEE